MAVNGLRAEIKAQGKRQRDLVNELGLTRQTACGLCADPDSTNYRRPSLEGAVDLMGWLGIDTSAIRRLFNLPGREKAKTGA